MFKTDGFKFWFKTSIFVLLAHAILLLVFSFNGTDMPTVGKFLWTVDGSGEKVWQNLTVEISRWMDLLILPFSLAVIMVIWAKAEDIRGNFALGIVSGIVFTLMSGCMTGLKSMILLGIFFGFVASIYLSYKNHELEKVFDGGLGVITGVCLGIFMAVGCFFGIMTGVIFVLATFIAFEISLIIMVLVVRIFLSIVPMTGVRINKSIK